MKIVSIFFPGEVIPRIIMVLDENAGDKIISSDTDDKLQIQIGCEELSFSEYSHYLVDETETETEEYSLTSTISKFVEELKKI